MSDVTLEINGRPYKVACEDGQEPHLAALAGRIDAHARRIAKASGGGGQEGRLMLLAGLMVADELSEAEGRIRALEAQVSDLRIKASANRALAGAVNGPTAERVIEIEMMVSELLNQAAEQMERMADRLDGEG